MEDVKDIFVSKNVSYNDALKDSFKKQWMKTGATNLNSEIQSTGHSVLGRSSMQGSGFGYPGISKPVYTKSSGKQIEDKE